MKHTAFWRPKKRRV